MNRKQYLAVGLVFLIYALLLSFVWNTTPTNLVGELGDTSSAFVMYSVVLSAVFGGIESVAFIVGFVFLILAWLEPKKK